MDATFKGARGASDESNRCWSIEDFHGWNKISIKDRIDSFNFGAFQADINALTTSSPKPLALEVSQVRFFSLKTIQFLDEVVAQLRSRELRAALVSPSEKLKRQIDIYADLERWDVFRSLSDLKANHPDVPVYKDRSENPLASL